LCGFFARAGQIRNSTCWVGEMVGYEEAGGGTHWIAFIFNQLLSVRAVDDHAFRD
jgi:hypothetical protein